MESHILRIHLKNYNTYYFDNCIPEHIVYFGFYFIPIYMIPPSRFRNPTIVFLTCLIIVAKFIGQW